MARQQPPSAPTGLLAVAVGGRQVLLAWNAGVAGSLGTRIGRTAGDAARGPFGEIGRVKPHILAFRDASVRPCTTYSYQVCAWNVSGDSQPSNVVEVTTREDGTEPQDD